ncbi:MAG: sulfate ABC transporter permease subunit [Actinomycetota bacterium]|nr:sulfate ABC transporter permease subunit [Actinomycetota bacterium]
MSAAPKSLQRTDLRNRATQWGLIGLAVAYVAVLLMAPIIGIAWKAFENGFGVIADTFKQPDVTHAFTLTAVITVVTVAVTALFGLVVAWVLARDRFPGKSLMNASVDVPFAVSPIIVGLMVVLLFGRGGWFEGFFAARGIQVLFALPSMILVTVFIAIPFVIREVAPVLKAVGTEEEDAARTLGASSTQVFRRITLPHIRWALAYGVALSTARALGEVGAVLVVSGAIQGHTETATLYVMRALDQNQTSPAYTVALSLAFVSIAILGTIEFMKNRRLHLEGKN